MSDVAIGQGLLCGVGTDEAAQARFRGVVWLFLLVNLGFLLHAPRSRKSFTLLLNETWLGSKLTAIIIPLIHDSDTGKQRQLKV